MAKCIGLLFPAVLAGPSLPFAETVTLESLLRDRVNPPALTRMPAPGYITKAATSHDRASRLSNPADGLYLEKEGRDWFANRDFGPYVRIEENNG